MSEILTTEEMQRSQKVAEANFVRVVQSLPESLCAREDSLQREFERLEESSLKKLGRLYDFMDPLYDCVDAHTACTSGCNACCHYAVSVSELEADFIEQKTTHTRRTETLIVDQPHGSPCPFLKDGQCSIYDSRPFVCRQHIMLDHSARWCAIDVCHDIELPQMKFSEIGAVFDQLKEGCSVKDVRAWFATPEPIS